MIRARRLAIVAAFLAACSSAAPAPAPAVTAALPSAPVRTAPATPPATLASATAAPTRAPQRFPAGLYAIRPSLQHPGGTVELVDPAGATVPRIEIFGAGWDVHPDLIVGPVGDLSGVTLYFTSRTARAAR